MPIKQLASSARVEIVGTTASLKWWHRKLYNIGLINHDRVQLFLDKAAVFRTLMLCIHADERKDT